MPRVEGHPGAWAGPLQLDLLSNAQGLQRSFCTAILNRKVYYWAAAVQYYWVKTATARHSLALHLFFPMEMSNFATEFLIRLPGTSQNS